MEELLLHEIDSVYWFEMNSVSHAVALADDADATVALAQEDVVDAEDNCDTANAHVIYANNIVNELIAVLATVRAEADAAILDVEKCKVIAQSALNARRHAELIVNIAIGNASRTREAARATMIAAFGFDHAKSNRKETPIFKSTRRLRSNSSNK